MAQVYVSELINGDYQMWYKSNIVFIETPTGTGKTTFIMEEYCEYAYQNGWKILYLVPRTILKKQLEEDLQKRLARKPLEFSERAEVLTIVTYQNLIQRMLHGNYSFLKEYDVIVVDEAHVILTDSSFNPEMILLYEMLKKCDDKVLIFISATLDEFRKLIIHEMPEMCESVYFSVHKDKEVAQ